MDNRTRGLMAAAGASAGEKIYVEDVFSTYLYTGNGSTQTITNGIDLSGKGGLLWLKVRTSAFGHGLWDTERGSASGNSKRIVSNSTIAQTTNNEDWITFNNNGFTANRDNGGQLFTQNAETYVSWTFRKAAKFFDVVTYTGDGASGRSISHNLQTQPGFIIVKRTDSTSDWMVDHLGYSLNILGGNPNNQGTLNSTSAFSWLGGNYGPWCYGSTSSQFTVGLNANASGGTYVAYLFAHDAGGFGDSGSDSVVRCGSFTADGSGNATVTLGWEPQWVLFKRSDNSLGGSWFLVDSMRGMPVGGDARRLLAESSAAEANFGSLYPTATGFASTAGNLQASGTYIYIAIRRGPMKTPTDATKVFSVSTSSANTGTITSGFPTDFSISLDRSSSGLSPFSRGVADRIRGKFLTLGTDNTAAENTNTSTVSFESNTGIILNGGQLYLNGYVHQQFRRAPGFFDVVAYTGTGTSARSITHNLSVAPQLIITKDRSVATNWYVLNTFGSAVLKLNLTDSNNTGLSAFTYGNGTSYVAPTASAFTVDVGAAQSLSLNFTGSNYVSYLFATCPGVSKVGSYTGSGTTKQIDCGFTNGARFVLIKRTDSTGDWYVWDTARGIVSGNDPFLLLNSTATENTSTDYIDPLSTGFEISSTAPAAINANGGSYIFLAIA